MIKINLLAEKKPAKAKAQSSSLVTEGSGTGQNLLLTGILLLGVLIAGGWWWTLSNQQAEWVQKHEEADRELTRLTEIRKKGEEYKQQKELLARKISLITELKKRQTVPVHIMDQVSRNLPEFLWLESMTASQSQINISGKATNFNSVSNFYQNLVDSGFFEDVTLGRTFEVREGVAFSLSCRFSTGGPADEPQG